MVDNQAMHTTNRTGSTTPRVSQRPDLGMIAGGTHHGVSLEEGIQVDVAFLVPLVPLISG